MSEIVKSENNNRASRLEFITPRANLHHQADCYILELEMPGVSKDGLDITVDNGKLTIIGHRGQTHSTGREIYVERPKASYRRVFDLDPSIDPASISAQINQGVLKVSLAKAEEARPRKITVS